MKVCYVMRPSFYELLQQYPELLYYSKDMTVEQRDLIFERINVQELMISASSYFQSAIVMENTTLYLEYALKQKQYKMECFEYFINVDSEKNPFLTFLKRKFRYFFIFECE